MMVFESCTRLWQILWALNMIKLTTAAAALLFSTVLTPVLAQATGFEILKPHRAVYDVTLNEAEDRSGIKGMQGRIVYEVQGNACDGMSVRYRFVTRINTGRDFFVTDQQTATHESADGNEFTFQTKSFVNDQPDQNITGFALRQDNGLKVQLTNPKPNEGDKKELILEDGLFTSAHLLEILKMARNGQAFASHTVFDGSGEADKVLNSASVIGKPKVVNEVLKGESAESVDAFQDREAWPVTMSYFNKTSDNTAEGLPIYEASFLLYEDGITRQLQMRYPDYSLNASLSEIEYYDTEACDN